MKEFKLDKSAGRKIKVACKECAGDTNHLVLKSVDESGSEPMGIDLDYQWHVEYQIIQCQGCDTVSFRSVSTNSEDYIQTEPDGDVEHEEYEELYPSRTEGRQVLGDCNLLPNDLERIYRETIAALNNKQPVLAGIGIRAIIETVSKEKKASGANLNEKINDLVTLGVLTTEGAAILHKLRVLGNDAAHEVKEHSPIQLNLAMDVIEHLLQAVYILPFHAKKTFK
jgi:hypothetical protein